MKFWKFFTLASDIISIAQASGPYPVVDLNSAVVKLSITNFGTFLQDNSFVFVKFFNPSFIFDNLQIEFSNAANYLNSTYPNIKLAQIDCSVYASICRDYGIKRYLRFKIFRDGASREGEDYFGPPDAKSITDYIIRKYLPPVQTPDTVESLEKLIKEQNNPFIIQVNPSANTIEIFSKLANKMRMQNTFISVEVKDLVEKLGSKFKNIDVSEPDTILVAHPGQFDNVAKFEGTTIDEESLISFIESERVPYFSEFTRKDTWKYYDSRLSLAFYFYKTFEQRQAVAQSLTKIAKKYRGKINIVVVNATLYGRKAKLFNMDPEIIPSFVIRDSAKQKKYGINQTEYTEGPLAEVISKFVDDYFQGKLIPLVENSEDLSPPKQEEIDNPYIKYIDNSLGGILGGVICSVPLWECETSDLEITDAIADPNSAVVKLTVYNFTSFLEANTLVLVDFFDRWCIPSQKLGPEFSKAADLLNPAYPSIKLAQVECNVEEKNCLDNDIKGYPTLKIIKNGDIKSAKVYHGRRDARSLTNYMIKQTLPMFRIPTIDEFLDGLHTLLALIILIMLLSCFKSKVIEPCFCTRSRSNEDNQISLEEIEV